jgi:hypothetical protein
MTSRNLKVVVPENMGTVESVGSEIFSPEERDERK